VRNHITGKVYDVTADSINALVSQLDASTAENAKLRTAQLSYLCPNHMATKLQPDGTCLACEVPPFPEEAFEAWTREDCGNHVSDLSCAEWAWVMAFEAKAGK
jgi:hypothetical protein